MHSTVNYKDTFSSTFHNLIQSSHTFFNLLHLLVAVVSRGNLTGNSCNMLTYLIFSGTATNHQLREHQFLNQSLSPLNQVKPSSKNVEDLLKDVLWIMNNKFGRLTF